MVKKRRQGEREIKGRKERESQPLSIHAEVNPFYVMYVCMHMHAWYAVL